MKTYCMKKLCQLPLNDNENYKGWNQKLQNIYKTVTYRLETQTHYTAPAKNIIPKPEKSPEKKYYHRVTLIAA